MIRRRALPGLALAGAGAFRFGAMAQATTPGEDGFYHEPWFLEGFLDLPDDLAEATAAGRVLAVVWELRGCAPCAEMHRVTLADPAVIAFLRAHAVIVQLDILGSRPATFPDGARLPEKAQAARQRVAGTPTLQLFNPDGTERARLQGFVRPEPFLAFFRAHAARG